MSTKRTELRQLVLLAMLFALALVLSWLEGFLPPIPAPVPLKFGLSNIAVMYALFFLNAPSAFLLALMKSVFVLMQRGFLSASLSLGGGLLSVAVMFLLSRLFKQRVSYLILSITGAIFHNIGQFSVLLIYYNVRSIAWIMPYLLITGVGTGILSASLLKMLIPALRKVPGNKMTIRTSPTDPITKEPRGRQNEADADAATRLSKKQAQIDVVLNKDKDGSDTASESKGGLDTVAHPEDAVNLAADRIRQRQNGKKGDSSWQNRKERAKEEHS